MRPVALFSLAALFLQPVSSAFACAACYGQSDSPMAAGMNWGIVSLLGIVVLVLGGVGAFFIYLARRSAGLKASPGAQAVAKEGGDKQALPTLEPAPLLSVSAQAAESTSSHHHSRLLAAASWPKAALTVRCERRSQHTHHRS